MSSLVYNVVGKYAPPQNVSNFSVSIVDEVGNFSWTPPTETDLLNTGRIEIRYSSDDTDWSQANKLASFTCGSTDASSSIMEGYYYAKFIDDNGIYSQTQATTSSLRIGRARLNTLLEVDFVAEMIGYIDSILNWDNLSNFDGVGAGLNSNLMSGLTIVDNYFELTATNTLVGFDSINNFDNLPDLDVFETIGTQVEGWFYTQPMDLGYVKTLRVFVDSDFIVYNELINFDDRTTLIDNWDSWDNYGDGSTGKGITVNHLASFTKDDPNDAGAIWTEYKPILFGDFDCRAIKMKVEIKTEDSNNQIKLFSTVASFGVRDIYETESNTSSSSGYKTIYHTEDFSITPILVISIPSALNGIYYETVSENNESFDIIIKDKNNNIVEKNFNYFAKGY